MILQLQESDKELKKHTPRPPLFRGGDPKSFIFKYMWLFDKCHTERSEESIFFLIQ